MVKLSKPGKMPCPSWSLQAIDTCPGSIGPDGELVDACDGCYATTGNYLFPNVKATREFNRVDWERDEWVDDMVAALSGESHFRWFDSGDMYHVKLATKILQVMFVTPETEHWLPTRMHKFDKFRAVIRKMEKLPNVVVRKSSDSIHGGIIRGRNTSTIFDPADNAPDKAHVCPAYQNSGKCGDCRACWNKEIGVIAYPQHGQKMARINVIARG